MDKLKKTMAAVKPVVASVNNRIDNIVAQAGTDNTEIVDARFSEAKNKTHTVLKDRLDEVENEIGVLSEMAEVTVESFGGKGDGVTDDTVAFQNALNYASQNRKKVKLGNKTYRIGTIDIPNGTYITGEGWTKSILKPIQGLSTPLLKITKPLFNFVTLMDFFIDGDYSNNTCPAGIYIDKSGADYENYYEQDTWVSVINVRVWKMYGDGIINYTKGRECRFFNLNLSYNNGWGFNHNGGSDNFIELVTCSYNLKGGFNCDGSANRYVNCKAFQNGLNSNTEVQYPSCGFKIGQGIGQTLIGCESQENMGHGFIFDNTKNGNFLSLRSDRNGMINNTQPTYQITSDTTPHSWKTYFELVNGTYSQVSSFQAGNVYYEKVLEYAGIHFIGAVQNINVSGVCDDFVVASGMSDGKQTQKCGVIFGDNMFCNIELQIKDMVNQYELPSSSSWILPNGGNLISINGTVISKVTMSNLKLDNPLDASILVEYGSSGTNRYVVGRDINNIFGIKFIGASGTQFGEILKINQKNITLGHSTGNIGFFGATGVAKKTSVADATDLATCITLINNLKSILKQYGLID